MQDDSAAPISLRIDLDPRIHFAMQQNDVPVIKALRIENRSNAPLQDLEVRITSEPAFSQGWSRHVAGLAAGAVYNVQDIDLRLSPSFLFELTERIGGQIRAELCRGDEVLAKTNVSIELLARDEWAGLSSLPEILAAFVLPNHPAIQPVLRSAADFLQQWTQNPSLDGYQSKDPKRVYAMAAAVYAALGKLGLTYVSPPASFEAEGQRVRLPDQILESRMATCLDLALLAAACLEQAGLHPLVVIVQGHAFTGVWLGEDSFPEPSIEDGLRLRKRVELGEIVVFDPTGTTARPQYPFERAIEEAKRHLSSEEHFLCAIDVSRARKGRIRPLPEMAVGPGIAADTDVNQSGLLDPSAPDVSSVAAAPSPEAVQQQTAVETPSSRLERWKRKLLDLSLRNRLLNFRDTKKTLPLLCPDLAKLEDMLAAGTAFRILPQPDDLGDGDPRDPAAHQRRTGKEALKELLIEELGARRLYSNTTKEDLDRRMTEIYRAARLGLEEGGASALYLAVGFLAWFETEKSEQRRLAPILLLPLELHRKSVREGFSLRLADDEPRINVTLLELLKQDYGLLIPGLDPLPEDESGLDVPAILNAVRRAVRDIDRWDVLNRGRIGLFSFTKSLMWRDLDERSDQLMKNSIVEHLVKRPDQAFDPGGSFPRADRLDEERAPSDTFCPLPADSSQLAAVFSAAEGRSFVLEGPPGTGKSQTITNLIAHCLTEGKTVLFVSEKMAALDVVHRRLVSVGLDRYCLELHSNKANKREVIGQLERALQQVQIHSEEEWHREARRLGELRNGLNAYVSALHRPRTSGETVFQATSRLIGLRDAPRVELHWTDPEALDADGLMALRDLVDRLATAGATCSEVRGHAWEAVQAESWTPAWEEEAHLGAESLRVATESLSECSRTCSERLGLSEAGWSFSQLDLMLALTHKLMASPSPPRELLVLPDWEQLEGQIGAWIERGRERDRLRSKLRAKFRDDIMKLDLHDLRSSHERASASSWPVSWWRWRPVRKALRSVTRDGKPLQKQQIGTMLDLAIARRGAEEKLDTASEKARYLLGRYWNDGDAKWDEVAKVRDWARELRSLALQFSGDDPERAASLREKWAQLASEGRELLRPDARLGGEFVAFGEALAAFKQARGVVADLLKLDLDSAWAGEEAPDALGRVRATVVGWQSGSRQLRDWCSWRRTRADAMRNNLAPLVAAFEAGSFASNQLREAFERSYVQWWIAAVTEREPVLSQFFSPEHERKIEQFREVDERYMQLTRLLVEARLAQRVPAASNSDIRNSETGILKREVGKKRRHMPVRQLLQKIPNLLPRLKPCLLMSPMSVAQYLDTSYSPFDLVVFDEASQIPVWDAVGAIARGRQAIIVGDPKQLPPTSFFQRSDDDEEGESDDVVEDLESILDDCIGAQIPWLPLDWHYRSRHESLITFSNHHYYDNRLLTFPSPAISGLGVSWRHVPAGVYDKGKSRTNRAEADAVVKEILSRLRDAKRAEYSIGVVTFSQAQQTLIEDLLDAARGEDPQLDPYFAEDRREPVFVKNLENVQGDERDVILFSICYGPDALGRVSMNFGPMNRDGGERRLNVAITRARREVLVFSTLRADQIDLSRTRARGVRDLKGFLEYAERGPAAIAAAVQPDLDADFDSPFEEAVYGALVHRGWDVHKQVGCARYRIDLAVVDPEARGRYLLGIECDGANYHRAKTARDRDKLREGVLRDLGWKLHRIWSTDWWTDPEREIRKLEEALERVLSDAGEEPTATPPAPPETESQAVASIPLARSAAEESTSAELERYRPVAVRRASGAQSEFYESSATSGIRERIVQVVQAEGPISLSLAAGRVASAWGFERVRAAALERVSSLIPKDKVRIRGKGENSFLWPIDVDADAYESFRVPGVDEGSARSAVELPPEEVANALLFVLRDHVSAPADEVMRETARLFGFQRTGRRVEERMRLGVEVLKRRGKIEQSGDNLTLCR